MSDGKGIDFSATADFGVSTPNEILADYEEGGWTPVITSATGTITTVGAVNGAYTKVGRSVTISWDHKITTNGTGATAILIGGLPFSAFAVGYGSTASRDYNSTGKTSVFNLVSSSIRQHFYDNSYPGANNTAWQSSMTYQTA